MAEIVSARCKSSCIRREIGVEKHHASLQVPVDRLYDGCLCGFHFRPRAGQSGAGRRTRGVDELDEQPVHVDGAANERPHFD